MPIATPVSSSPKTIYLADYTPPAYLIDTVDMIFDLSPDNTRVTTRIMFRPNPDSDGKQFFLHGENLSLIWAKIDGTSVTPDLVDGGLTCAVPDAPFIWETCVEIAPAQNTELEGLYMSNGMYCTQCEAEGFRKITYYPDRPDVMAVFTVQINSALPVLLSNGNPVGHGKWHDPWPKPAYLFALVAGDLVTHTDSFTTLSGTDVALNIYVRPGSVDKCAFGMQALKAAMTWDENTYGREYDLDIFNIVAVDDFNMGAMENKGLNIFNASCVLASPTTATDADFERIEAIIAHEYFHNWTGNRITCRDWFQLCLKEGLTVYRDQQFTGDMRGHAVKRIDDALTMHAHQFREDGGPLAHPVRPNSFVEINNFYTATVYEKGAEVIGMLRRIVGHDAYTAACTLYFDRHDGQAVTIEDWLAAFEDTTGRDLTQFARWYTQAGTPHVHVTEARDGDTYVLTMRQELPATPDGNRKNPQVIPVDIGLIGPDGSEVLATQTLILTKPEQSYRFDTVPDGSVLSVLRDFSAPVVVHHAQSTAELALLLAHDTDPFNRWDAGRKLATKVLQAMITDDTAPDITFLDGLAAVMGNDALDPAFRARVMSMPSQADMARTLAANGHTPDPLVIYQKQQALVLRMAQHLQDITPHIHAQMVSDGPYSPNGTDAAKRALGNTALAFINRLDGGVLASAQFETATNMTQQRAALGMLLTIGKGDAANAAFFDQWQHDRLVMDKWFSLQVSCAHPDTAVAVARTLIQHPLFDWKNPNRVRAVIGALLGNQAGFHAADGSGYSFVADCLITLDPINPQTTAGIATAFDSWAQFDPARQTMMRDALRRVADTAHLSGDTSEIIARILG